MQTAVLALMSEGAFYEKVREIFSDVLLTDAALWSNRDTHGTVLRARKVNPATLAFDYRLLRRAAGVESSAVLRDFPLNIDGDDLVVS